MSFADDSNGNAAETNVINCSVYQVVINYFLQVVINLQMFLRQVSRVECTVEHMAISALDSLAGKEVTKTLQNKSAEPLL